MAQPVNTFDSYDMRGIKEDLQDIIYDISPEETPFYSSTAKVKASNAFHEWQTDALRASADNAHIEGDDTTPEARTATTRLGNYAQIFKNAVTIPGSDAGLSKAGRNSEMVYQVLKIAKEQKKDIEKALFANQARVAGSGTVARRLAGTGAWVNTNTDVGSGGSDPTGDGTNARTDGTQAAFSQTRFDNVMQQIWVAGGAPDSVYLSAFQMQVAQGFTGNNNQNSIIKAEGEKVFKHMAVYVTPWGTVTFKPTRENRSRDVWVMQNDMWKIGVRRPTFNSELAKTGDNDKRQVITELTLVCANEAAHGLIADCTTS
jgi:hypothetical protein